MHVFILFHTVLFLHNIIYYVIFYIVSKEAAFKYEVFFLICAGLVCGQKQELIASCN